MAGSLKTLNIYQNGSSIYEASTFTSYGIWTDGNKIYKTNSHTPQSGDTELVTLTTPISGLYHNADGEQVSVGLNTVLVITTIVATDIAVYCVNASIKTTLDLSTLSDIADGAHTVKVKAKADGYYDSEFSNEVSYTKVSAAILSLEAGDLYGPTMYSIYYEINGKVTSNSSQTGSDSVNIELAPNDYVDVAATSSSHEFREYNGKVYSIFGGDASVVKANYNLNGNVYRISNMTTNSDIKFWVYA